MKIKSIVSFAIILFFAFDAYSQQNDRLARGCATKESKKLSFLTGTWKVKNKTRLAGNNDEWETHIGTSKIKFIFDQCLLVEKLSIKREGRPLTVLALYSYNNIAKKYQWTFAHSEHGMLSLYEGFLSENTFRFKYSLEIQGRKRLFKRLLIRGSSGFEMLASRSNDNGKTWRLDSRLTYYK